MPASAVTKYPQKCNSYRLGFTSNQILANPEKFEKNTSCYCKSGFNPLPAPTDVLWQAISFLIVASACSLPHTEATHTLQKLRRLFLLVHGIFNKMLGRQASGAQIPCVQVKMFVMPSNKCIACYHYGLYARC